MKILSAWSRSRLEPEPTQVGRSRSRLRDLGHPEPEPERPKKVAAPQHCKTDSTEDCCLQYIVLVRYRTI